MTSATDPDWDNLSPLDQLLMLSASEEAGLPELLLPTYELRGESSNRTLVHPAPDLGDAQSCLARLIAAGLVRLYWLGTQQDLTDGETVAVLNDPECWVSPTPPHSPGLSLTERGERLVYPEPDDSSDDNVDDNQAP